MAQHDYVIANGTGAAVRSDLNNALAAIVSQNSGATEPATTYAFQFWADTTTGTLKLRNSANSAWIELLQLDGTLTMEDGTEALPGLSFRSDLDTGLWRPGANQLAISTNAVERVEFGASEVVFNDGGANYDFRVEGDTNANLLFVDASADAVGIGTSSPGAQLDVYNSQASGISEVARLRWNNGGAGGALTYANQAGTVVGQIANVGSASGTELAFYTFNNSTALGERIRIDASGRVGIGNTIPGSFDTQADDLVVGSGSGHNGVSIYAGTGSWSSIYFADGTAGSDKFRGIQAYDHSVDAMLWYTAAAERARIDSSGRLLVGTSTAPTSGGYNQYVKLLCQGNTSNSAGTGLLALNRGENATTITANEEIGAISFGDSAGNEFAYIVCSADANAGTNDFPGRLTFSTTADGASSPTERAKITNAGYFKATTLGAYVGDNEHEFINNTNNKPVLRLQSNAGNGTQYGLLIRTVNDQNDATRHFFQCLGDTTERVTFRSNGGLANYSANNVNLSDITTKKDIIPAAGTWDCIKEWEIVNYRYKDQPDDAELNLGVIAQQVAESCPEVITVFEEAKDDQPEKLGIKEQQMYWMAIKALQEAQIRIEALEAEVAALKAQ